MLDVSEARARILKEVSFTGEESVSLLNSLGRVLASSVVSDLDLPPFRNSAVDGYAVYYEDTICATREKPVKLKVIYTIQAGGVPKSPLSKGEAVKIMTGAPVPEEATAVVMVEDTSLLDSNGSSNENWIFVHKEVTKEENIRERGEDVSSGETVIHKGKRIRPQEIAMLASLGWKEVPVYKRPKVAILSTGDELVELGEAIPAGKIRNSNSYALAALVAQYGGEPVYLGIARDNLPDTETKIKAGLTQGDIFITSAGVSVGEYDLVKDVFKKLGIELSFWQVAMQPGRPVVFASWNGKLVFGLPGNPVSSMIAFEEFVRPALLSMTGSSQCDFFEVRAIAKEPIKKKAGRQHFLRGICWQEDGSFYVRLTGPQGSGIQKSMVRANCIIVVPKDVTEVKTGEEVTIQLLNYISVPFSDIFNNKVQLV